MSYIYITEDNTIHKQKYNYSQYSGKFFLQEYMETRETFIKSYPVENIDEDIVDTSTRDSSFDMIFKLYCKLLYGALYGHDLECFRKLVKSFEVRKLIYSQYSLDWKIGEYAVYDNYESYLVFGLCLIKQYEYTKCTKYLSCLLKLDDTLISIQNKLTTRQKSCLSIILLRELDCVSELSEQLGLGGL